MRRRAIDRSVDTLETWWRVFAELLVSDVPATVAALGLLALFTLAERRWPAEAGHGAAGRVRNLVYLFQYKVLGSAAIAIWLLVSPTFTATDAVVAALPAPLLVLANLVVLDLLYYVYHRAQHRFRWLWAIHELHHADAELNATTSYRTFFAEALVQGIVIVLPSSLLFAAAGPGHLHAVIVCTMAFLILGHANLRLELGRWSVVVCGPQVHRIHHSRLPEHQDRNFAQIFPWIDKAFGTWFAPRAGEFPPTGTPELASDAPVPTALARPFRIWTGTAQRRPSEAI